MPWIYENPESEEALKILVFMSDAVVMLWNKYD